jgi:hypothetical protein
MTETQPEPIRRWHAMLETRDFSGLDTWLADDAVFQSPAVHTPQAGKAVVKAYLLAAGHVLGNATFRYLDAWYAPRSAVLEFQCSVDGLEINGIDMIHWDEQGRVVRFKVMIRPLKALQGIVPLMATRLAAGPR